MDPGSKIGIKRFRQNEGLATYDTNLFRSLGNYARLYKRNYYPIAATNQVFGLKYMFPNREAGQMGNAEKIRIPISRTAGGHWGWGTQHIHPFY